MVHPPDLLSAGELINLALFCERMRRRFWPEWFMEGEDLYFQGDGEDSSSSSSGGGGGSSSRGLSPTPTTWLLDLGLFSRTDTLEDNSGGTRTHSPGSDRSLFDSDVGTGSDNEAQMKTETITDGQDF